MLFTNAKNTNTIPSLVGQPLHIISSMLQHFCSHIFIRVKDIKIGHFCLHPFFLVTDLFKSITWCLKQIARVQWTSVGRQRSYHCCPFIFAWFIFLKKSLAKDFMRTNLDFETLSNAIELCMSLVLVNIDIDYWYIYKK